MAQVGLNDVNNFAKYMIIRNFYEDDKKELMEYLTQEGLEALAQVVDKKEKNIFRDNPLKTTIKGQPKTGGADYFLKLSKSKSTKPISQITKAFQTNNYSTNTGSKYFNYDKIKNLLQNDEKLAEKINQFADRITDERVSKINKDLSQSFTPENRIKLTVTDKDVVTPDEGMDKGPQKEKEVEVQFEDIPQDAPVEAPVEEGNVQVEFQDAPVDAPVTPDMSKITEQARNNAIKEIMDSSINNVLKKEILKTLNDLTKPKDTPNAQVEFENAPVDAPTITQDVRDLLPEARSRAGVAQGATRRSREELQRMIESGQAQQQGVDIFDVDDEPEFEPRITQDPELLQPEGTIARTANRIFQSIAQGLTQQLPQLLIQSGNNLDRLQMDVRNRVGRRAAALDFTSKIGLNILFALISSLVSTWYNSTYAREEPVQQVEPVPIEEPPTEKPKEGSQEIKIEDDLRQLLQEPPQNEIVKQEPLIVQVQPEPNIINVDPEKNKERYNKFVFNESKNKDNNPLVDLNELNENLRFFKNYINYNLETRKIFGEYTKPGELGKRISGTTTNIRGAPNYIAFNPRVENLGSNFETDPHQSIKDWFSRDQGALDTERWANFQF